MNSPPRPPAATEPRYFSRQVVDAHRFYLRLNPAQGQPLAVLSGGMERCREDYRIERPGFPHPIIEFVARGAGLVVLKGRQQALTPGSIFTYGRGIPHVIQSDPAHPLVKYFVVLSGKAGRALLQECHLAPGTAGHVAQPDRIQQVFEDLIRHGRDDHPDRGRMCAIVVQYLILQLGDLMRHDTLLPQTRAFQTYLRCRESIRQHARSLRSLDEVARHCRIDRAYLCRLFQRFGRESPGRYLLHLRLTQAAEKIQTSDLSIKEVASALGFSDAYNFSRAFRRTFGVPPGTLRNQLDTTGRPHRDAAGP